jgi:rfaE bifunctional protein nucleotidyltransferase chain/domain
VKIVCTNGCFDVLHAGHVALLREARSLGDRLIILLNSDRSVKRLKGPSRPIHGEQDRMAVLLALGDVDDVVMFDYERDLENLIRQIRPTVLVKGDDYLGKPVTGANLLPEWGGVVHFVKRLANRSTSIAVERSGKSADGYSKSKTMHGG